MHKEYEIHLTFNKSEWEHLKSFENELLAFGFFFSCIDGDPALGAKPFCYITGYSNRVDELFEAAMGAILTVAPSAPIRTKIERIVYDTKHGIDEIANEKR